jgi:hypothetical protein
MSSSGEIMRTMNQVGKEIKQFISGNRKILLGLLVAWAASIAFAIQLRTLLTPGNYPIGSDPSFDMIIAALFFILFLLGILLAYRTWLDNRNGLVGEIKRYLRVSVVVLIILFLIGIVTDLLLYSAGYAFQRDYNSFVMDAARPDYSFPEFPTPQVSQPTPVSSSGTVLLSGNITSGMDGLRVGSISIRVNSSVNTLEAIQVLIHRINCTVQQGTTPTIYAVDETKFWMPAPIQVTDGSFFASMDQAVLFGIFASPENAHGTLYIVYTDPQTQQTCSLGNFDWTVNPVP